MKIICGIIALTVSLAISFESEAQDFLTNGLVAYYPLNGNTDDASGNSNHGILVGTDWSFSLNRYGQQRSALFLNTTSTPSIILDGTYVSAPRSAALDFSNDFTLSLWVNLLPGWTNVQETLIANGSDGDGAVALAISPSGSVYGGNDGLACGWGGINGVGVAVPPVRNSWRQFVAVRSGSKLTLFTNGSVETNMVTMRAPVNYPTIWFGRFQPVPSGNQNTLQLFGGIDDVRMYNRALSGYEVHQLYAYESSGLYSAHSAAATATLVNGTVGAAIVIDSGCGYTNTPRVLIQGGGGSGATAAAVVINGEVVGITITDAGVGYSTTPNVYIYSPLGLQIGLLKAVKPLFTDLFLGTNYQLQVSSDLDNWTNQGSAFTATNTIMVYPQYWDVDNWGKLFFRLDSSP